jgi:hypothetical protein
MYAIIENDLIVNVVVTDDENYAQEKGWVLIPNFAGVGWFYIDGEFIDKNKVIINNSEKIKSDIAALEASVTPRRQREAILAIDTTWLADVELQIGQLRQQLMEL